jgi:hypothetical protein
VKESRANLLLALLCIPIPALYSCMCVPSTLCSGCGVVCQDNNECCSLVTCGLVNQGILTFCGYFPFHRYVFWECCPRSSDLVLNVSGLDSFIGDVSSVFLKHRLTAPPEEVYFARSTACRSVHVVHRTGSSNSQSRHAGRDCNQPCLRRRDGASDHRLV